MAATHLGRSMCFVEQSEGYNYWAAVMNKLGNTTYTHGHDTTDLCLESKANVFVNLDLMRMALELMQKHDALPEVQRKLAARLAKAGVAVRVTRSILLLC